MSEQSKQRVVKQGVVRSDKMQKTVVVEVTEKFKHPLYGKVVQRGKRYKAHDETGMAHPGDRVEIESCRPISKQKHWKVSQILQRSQTSE